MEEVVKMKNIISGIMDGIKNLFRKRNFKYGTTSMLVVLLTLGCFWFVTKILGNFNLQLDMTASKQFSLSPQTVKIIKGLKEELRITAIVKKGMGYDRYMGELLRDIQKQNSKVKVKILDLDFDRTAASAYKVNDYNVTIVEMGDKRKDIFERDVVSAYDRNMEFKGEQAIINAVLSISEAKKKVICFTEGHKEKDLTDLRNVSGYGFLKQLLVNDNYEVRSINIMKEGKIPEDCTVLVVGGPQFSFANKEVELVSGYLDKGGKAVMLFDPLVTTGFDKMLETWGLKLDNDFVIDPKSYLNMIVRSDPGAPIPEWQKHAITEPFIQGRIPVFFPASRSISDAGRAPGRAYTKDKLMSTTDASWGETDLQSLRSEPGPKKDDKDVKSPLVMGWAVTEYSKDAKSEDKDTKQMKFVIIGDSDFCTNAPSGIGGMQGNLDLFVNSVNWLIDEGAKISIRPKTIDVRSLQSLTSAQWTIMFVMTIIVAPLIVVGGGIFVFLKRRKK
ncbi:MAG: Gldg family protein [Candidatus Firestonebacteria bacterium]